MEPKHDKKYWSSNLRIVGGILTLWFICSYGCSIIFRDWLDANFPSIGHAPFGFWMAQQGSIIVFVILLLVYAFLMNRLDEKHGYFEDGDV